MATEQPRKRALTPESSAPHAPTKKPYRAPRLIEYGDLRTITRGKAGNMDDGTGAAPTRK